jgi:cyclopropane fatty-acyl-phospholipid synthase-like methyltransferase
MKNMTTMFVETDEKYSGKFGTSLDFKSLGWGSKESQLTRFRILIEIPGFNQGDSVLDVGCGHGDFCTFFNSNYKGIDIRESVIKISREKYKDVQFESKTIFEETQKFDWIFGSGLFGFKHEDWSKYVFENLKRMYQLSNKGFAVNFLSTLSPGKKDPDMMYSHPVEISEIVSRLSSKFIIRHDYRPNDMTVYIFK